MQNVAVATTSSDLKQIKLPQTLRTNAILGAITLAALWLILCRHLSNEWSANDQYSYGWFVPFFAAYLFWLRWEDRPAAFDGNIQHPTSDIQHRSRPCWIAVTVTVLALFLLLPVRLVEVGNPDWRPLGWIHASIVVALTLFIVWRIGGATWLRHFAFPICFTFVAVPWISDIEIPLVQGLMRIVAAIATEILNLLGQPAKLEGNLIRVNTGLVGVNEACSGVRSLQTSLMIGLLFGELQHLVFVRRIVLVAGAIGIAFVANCLRALFLVWLAASEQVQSVSRWHDIAGYSIVVAVFVGTMLLAAALRAPKGEKAKAEDKIKGTVSQTAFLSPASSLLLVLCWLIAVEIGVEAWYRAHEGRLVKAAEPWSVHWPENAPGFRAIAIPEETKNILRFDQGREAAWILPSGSNESLRANMFFFRWNPGTGSILRARSHRPDICLPSVGWEQTGDFGVRSYFVNPSHALPFRHFSFKAERPGQSAAVAHAFFCMREDKVPANAAQFDIGRMTATEWDRSDRLRVVLKGLRNPGQQMLQLILLG
ncbi:MAG: exosortase/archaeosortase family protein, partial [Limisphaerales bacterium]